MRLAYCGRWSPERQDYCPSLQVCYMDGLSVNRLTFDELLVLGRIFTIRIVRELVWGCRL